MTRTRRIVLASRSALAERLNRVTEPSSILLGRAADLQARTIAILWD